MKITLLHPSRSRADIAIDTKGKWLDMSSGKHEIEYILSIDEDDPAGFKYSYYSRNHIINKNRSAVDAINNAAKVSTGDILIVLSDDFECPRHWDDLIVKATEGKTDWILKTNDGIQKWIITIPIMDRAYYNRFGYVYNPEYLHMFCDTELTCVADLIDRKIEVDIVFNHNHYSTGKFIKDAVSIRADKTWNQGEEVFLRRYKNKFDLVDIKGKITSQEYLNWIAQKL